MPNMRRDKHSGGLVFDLTPNEIKVKNLEETVETLTQKLATVEKYITDTTTRKTEK